MRLMLATALAAVALAGCGAGAPLDRGEVEAVALDNANAALEFDDAVDRVARVCMEDRGFTVHPARIAYSRYDADVLLGSDVYTDPDVTGAVEDRYRMWFGVGVDATYTSDTGGPRVSYGQEVDDFILLPRGDQDAYFDALYRDDAGGPEFEEVAIPDLGRAQRASGGCQRAAEDALTDGDYVAHLAHAGLAGAKGSTGWSNDERVVAARSAWSSCMAEYGHDFSHPADVRLAVASEISRIEAPADLSDPDAFAAAEVELAGFVEPLGEADHACHGRADLERVQSDVYWEYMVEHVSANQEEFFSFRERVDEYLAVAQEIVDRGRL